MKEEANTDTTYCTNDNCIEKCWRHVSNWKFDVNKDYWMQEYCEEERKRIMKLLGVKE